MPLNYILRKCTGDYKFRKSQEKINHFIYVDDIKVFVKNERELETLIQIINCLDGRIRFLDYKICHVDDKKGKKRNNGRNKTTKSGKYQNTLRKRKFQVRGNI